MKPAWASLHNHSSYSIGDSTALIASRKLSEGNMLVGMVERAKSVGMGSLALTDHGTMAGIPEFLRECKKYGIKGIIGSEFYISVKSATEPKSHENPTSHIILLAQNIEGYKNLCALTQYGNRIGFYRSPRIDLEILSKHLKGVIATTSCIGGLVQKKLLGWSTRVEGSKVEQASDIDGAIAMAIRLKEMFEPDHFFLEVQNHRMPDSSKLTGKDKEDYDWMIDAQRKVANFSLEYGAKLDIPCVGAVDSHYVDPSMADTRQVTLAMRNVHEAQDNKLLPFGFTGEMAVDDVDNKRASYEGLREITGQMYIKSAEEMYECLHGREYPELLSNTLAIADMCEVDISVEQDERGRKKFDLPSIDLGDGESPAQKLRKLCEEGFSVRYKADDLTAVARLNKELEVIEDLKLVEYHLVIWDFVAEAHRRHILVGPGRGSAAGSCACYCLGITDIDPIKHDLSFDRYLIGQKAQEMNIEIPELSVKEFDRITR